MRSQNNQTESAPGAQKALILLLAIACFNYIDRQMLPAILTKMQPDILPAGSAQEPLVAIFGKLLGSHPEYALLGLLGTTFMVAFMIATPLVSMARARKWLVLGIGVGLWSLACGLTGMVHTFQQLLAVRCLVGVGEATFAPIGATLIGDYFTGVKRVRMMSLLFAAIPVGSALGYIIGGMVATHFGWRVAFYSSVIPGLILAGLCLRMKDPQGAQSSQGSSGFMSKSELLELLKNKSFVLTTAGMTAMTFVVGGIGFWMPTFMTVEKHQANLQVVNSIFGIILVVSGLIGSLAGGWLSAKLQKRFPGAHLTVPGVSMLLGLPCWFAALALPMPWSWLGLFLCCAFIFTNAGPTETVLVDVTRQQIQTRAFALNVMIMHALGDVISPVMIGMIADKSQSMTTAFFWISLPILAAAAFWLLGARYLQADIAAVTSSAQPPAAPVLSGAPILANP